ncbi:MAG: helix-turn-helix domain-containing protein [Deltaproteobacteria bacterium]|nr:helix-turn-helix domain-containing protein [Deltaproteobacteria bacterium]
MTRSSAPPTTQRARKKRATLAKIHAAAWTLFAERGYEGCTTRLVAERAGVAVGTLFVHVRDKDALLRLVYGARVDSAFGEAFRTVRDEVSVLDRLDHVFAPLFLAYCEQPDLAFRFLHQTLTLEGADAKVQSERERQFCGSLTALLTRASLDGDAREDLDSATFAENLFALYRHVVLRWLRSDDARDPDIGRRALRRVFAVAWQGARPRKKAQSTMAPSKNTAQPVFPSRKNLAPPKLPQDLRRAILDDDELPTRRRSLPPDRSR